MNRMTKGEIRTFQFDFKKADGTAYDLTGQTLIEVIFVAPDGTRTDENATLVGAATAGSFKYAVAQGYINQAGPWRAWGHFKIGTADEKYGADPIEVYVQEAP